MKQVTVTLKAGFHSGPVHTYPDIFENASFFIRFGLASTRRRRFRSPKMNLFENAVFMLSCGRVKTKLFENADVTASIYDVTEHAHGSLGTTQGHFNCLFSFIKVQTVKFESSSVFVWTGIFSKALLVWTRIFLKTDKKRCVFKNIRIRVDGASVEFSEWTGFCTIKSLSRVKFYSSSKRHFLT